MSYQKGYGNVMPAVGKLGVRNVKWLHRMIVEV